MFPLYAILRIKWKRHPVLEQTVGYLASEELELLLKKKINNLLRSNLFIWQLKQNVHLEAARDLPFGVDTSRSCWEKGKRISVLRFPRIRLCIDKYYVNKDFNNMSLLFSERNFLIRDNF